MSERVLHALSPPPGRLVEGVERVRISPLRIEHRRQLSNVDAAPTVVDDSIGRPNRAALRIGVRRRMLRPQSWRSTAMVEWPRKTGIEHFPAIFGGEAVEHINPSARAVGVNPEPTGVR